MTNKTKEFLQKLKDSGHWNNEYDYSKVEYVSAKTKVIVIDTKLGTEHQMTPTNMICRDVECSIRNAVDQTDYFLRELKDNGHWNVMYDYSKVEYVNTTTKVIVIDKNYGTEHHLKPESMTRGVGYKCLLENSVDKNRYLIKEFEEIHGEIYNYSKINYIDNDSKMIIICPEHGEFRQSSAAHKVGKGCHKCVGRGLTTQEIIVQFKGVHGNKYDYSRVIYVNNLTKVIIMCPEHGEFEQSPTYHKQGHGCQKCGGNQRLTTNEIIKRLLEIYGDKYDYSKVEYVSNLGVVIVIDRKYGTEHIINTSLLPKCSVVNAVDKTDYFLRLLKDSGQWNNEYNYSKVEYISNLDGVIVINKKYGTEHIISPKNLIKGINCVSSNAMDRTHYLIKQFKEVHGDIYDYSKMNLKMVGRDKITIICTEHGEFEQTPNKHNQGQGCPVCNHGFSKPYKLSLLNDLSETDLLTLDPVELQIIIQQGALPNDFRPLVNTDADSDERVVTIRELQERFESENEPEDDSTTTQPTETTQEAELVEVDDVDDEITKEVESELRLPSINSTQDLRSLDNTIYSSMDEEAFESLIEYKIRKYWNKTLNDVTDVSELRNETGGKYFTEIKETFINEYDEATKITPIEGYSFRGRDGNIAQPNLMQKLTVYRLLKNKYYGNWSGTGAGKTLSFILASRNMDARLTLVIALNSTVKQLCKEIKGVYPDSKCFTEYKEWYVFDRVNHNYLVLNYEKFQQDNSEGKFQSLTSNNQIDFVVIDEVHNAKQRTEEEESIRRGVMVRLLGRARENDGLHILAMSATPVINNLYEAKSLLELMSGLEYNDLQTRRTIGNAINVFKQLTLNGLRFIPNYAIQLNELTGRNMSNLSIDGSHLLDDLLGLSQSNYTGVEKLILNDKLKAITPYIRKGVVIYTYFTSGIVNNVQKHVESLGFKVGTYTGDESSILRDNNLKDFIAGKIDVLIGSKPIGTGVDGLQEVSDRMICITLPWTDSEYTQLKGRIYRQGSEFDNVEIIIPQVRIPLEGGEVWSWDVQRLNLIKNKRTLADAAVDGVIPSRILPSKETMFKKSIESLKNWQDRVIGGNVVSSERNIIQMDLYPELDGEERESRINSELSEFNRRGKTTKSSTMHKEFTDNPDSWRRYHALRNERMGSWEEIPYEYIATKIKDVRDVVADFGCGENLFKDCIPNNQVYSFDHVAIDDTVIACDMKETRLDSESIDVTVFSLALWGTNSDDYIKESYRILRRKGVIYIAEPSKNYETLEEQEKLIGTLNEVGFQQVGLIENRGKFIYLTGIKI